MRGRWSALLALLLVALWSSVAAAYVPPPIRGHVNDQAGVLSKQQVASLERELTELRRSSGYHVVLLIVPSLADEPIEDVAYDTFNTWKIGDAKLDNGTLLVLAVAEQRIRIETGKGVGGELTDIESGRIIREQIKPLVVEGRWYDASVVGTRAIGATLTGKETPRGPPPPSSTSRELSLLEKLLIAGALLVVVILAIIFPGFRRVLFWVVWGLLRSRGGGGGGFDGGGGGGYRGGGGRSGGGGASG